VIEDRDTRGSPEEVEPAGSSLTSTRTDLFGSPPDPAEIEEWRREREGGPGPPPSWLPLEGDTRPPGSGPRGFRQPGVSRSPRGRRADILDAALKLFNDSSYPATTVQDIANQANASVGSVYHHFEGKEDIAASIYVGGLADYHRGLLRELRREHESAEAAVKGLVRNHLRWVERNPELARFLFTSRDREVVSVTGDELDEMNQRVFQAVQRWMDRWIEAGEVQRLPIGLLHSVVLGPSQEFCRHWVASRMKVSIDAAEPVLAEAAWKAVRA
jgi:AcrR family transcriptional regulator